jgi:hypothetical protein
MKKFTFGLMLAAVALFAASPLFAEGMMFGVKGGVNMANLSGDDVSNTKSRTVFMGGAFMSYNISEIFAIQPELLYAMKGAAADIPDFDASLNLSYIEIPILFKVNLPTEGKIKPSLYAGPSIGFLMSAEADSAGTTMDIKDYAKSTDYGIIAGGSLGYQMGNGGLLFLEARYEIGLTSIAEKGFSLIGEDVEDLTEEELAALAEVEPDIKNSGFSIMVGYGFAF